MKEDNTFTVKNHFEGKEAVVRKTYDELLKVLRTHGPIVENAGKNSIRLVHNTTMAGVSTRRNFLILTIKSDRALASPRIRKTSRVSPHCFHLKMKLTSPTDLNEELIGWLGNAYALSAAN